MTYANILSVFPTSFCNPLIAFIIASLSCSSCRRRFIVSRYRFSENLNKKRKAYLLYVYFGIDTADCVRIDLSPFCFLSFHCDPFLCVCVCFEIFQFFF